MKQQGELPGTERERIEILDERGLEWRDLLEQRSALDVKIEHVRSEIHAELVERGLAKYLVIDGDWERVLTYETRGAVKMRKPKADEVDE